MKSIFFCACLLLTNVIYADDTLFTDCTPLSVQQTSLGALVYCQETVIRGDSQVRFYAISYKTFVYNPTSSTSNKEVKDNQFLLMMEAVSHGKKLNIGYGPNNADQESDCLFSNCRMIRSIALLK